MVNGPRPAAMNAPLNAPSTARGPSTPTILTRQRTSMYSTASTATPVLVYGKMATPLQGAWAEEPWSPKPRANTETIALVETLDAPIGTAEPADDSNSTFSETLDRQHSAPSEISAAAPPPARAAPTGHLSFLFRYDPYNYNNRVEMHRCNCDECFDRHAAVTGTDLLATSAAYNATSSTYISPAATRAYDDISSMGQPVNSYDYDATVYAEDVYGMQACSVAEDPRWAAPQPAVEVPVTSFMPPPPPPRITRRVIAESAEPTLDAESAFYLIIMRWYNKVVAAQKAWVRNDDVCPEPDLDKYSFDAWVDEIGRWWLRNFEHVQVKTSASSGAIRAAGTTLRRPGFETHASRALLPRRQLGSSGLTAEMLESHNQVVEPHPLATRPRRELPW